MKSASLAVFVLASVMTRAALAQPANVMEERGEALVQQHCAMCHAIGAQENSPEPRAPAFRKLYDQIDPDGLRKALERGMAIGHPEMPRFKLDGNQIEAILAYIDSIQE